MENILFGQFVILIVKMTYTRSTSYCFSAPVKICYANEYMLVLHLNICVTVNKAICVEVRHGSWQGWSECAGPSEQGGPAFPCRTVTASLLTYLLVLPLDTWVILYPSLVNPSQLLVQVSVACGSPVPLTSGCSCCSVWRLWIKCFLPIVAQTPGYDGRNSFFSSPPRGICLFPHRLLLSNKCYLVFRLISKCLFLVKKLANVYFSHF